MRADASWSYIVIAPEHLTPLATIRDLACVFWAGLGNQSIFTSTDVIPTRRTGCAESCAFQPQIHMAARCWFGRLSNRLRLELKEGGLRVGEVEVVLLEVVMQVRLKEHELVLQARSPVFS